MALQLSLPLVEATAEPRRLWVLSAAPRHLSALRHLLMSGSPRTLIDTSNGISPVTPGDAILLRHPDGSYEGFGAAAALLAASQDAGRDLTAEILAAQRANRGEATELLAASLGRARPRAVAGGLRSGLEVLFHRLGAATRPALQRRIALCARALSGLTDDQGWLRALLAAQAARLARAAGVAHLAPASPEATLGDCRALERHPGLRRLRPTLQPSTPGPEQLTFLPPSRPGRRASDPTGLSAFRVWGASIALAPALPVHRFASFTEGFDRLDIDERRLGAALGPLQARAVTAVVRMDLKAGSTPALRVSVDWELRQGLGAVFPTAHDAPVVQLWVEDSRGGVISVAKRVILGQELTVPSSGLRRGDRVRGVVAFRTMAGHVARQPFAFAV